MLNISHVKDSTGVHTMNTKNLLIQPFISTTGRTGTKNTRLQLHPTDPPCPEPLKTLAAPAQSLKFEYDPRHSHDERFLQLPW